MSSIGQGEWPNESAPIIITFSEDALTVDTKTFNGRPMVTLTHGLVILEPSGAHENAALIVNTVLEDARTHERSQVSMIVLDTEDPQSLYYLLTPDEHTDLMRSDLYADRKIKWWEYAPLMDAWLRREHAVTQRLTARLRDMSTSGQEETNGS